MPDRTLLLRIDPGAGLARAGDRGEAADRLEREASAFFAATAAAYDELAAAEPERFAVLDASLRRPRPAAALRRSPAALTGAPPDACCIDAVLTATASSKADPTSTVQARLGVALRVRLRPLPGVGDHRLELGLARLPAQLAADLLARRHELRRVAGAPGLVAASGSGARPRARPPRRPRAPRSRCRCRGCRSRGGRAPARRARAGARRRGPRRGCSRGPRSRPASGSRCRRSRSARAGPPPPAAAAGSRGSRGRGPRPASPLVPATLK